MAYATTSPRHSDYPPDDHYAHFLASKALAVAPSGFDADPAALPPSLFDFQSAIVRWALRLGKAAIFADTGLGKTLMQLAWAAAVARHSGGRVLILTPLAVAAQTVAEGARFGIAAAYCRDQAGADASDCAIVVANYERLHLFDPAAFVGVVLDESSILKSYDGKTRTALIEAFARTPFRLACTATPAPNDFTEIGNHAEFLAVLTRVEMLATFFVHDGGSTKDWRLKGHATADFWRWVASWAIVIKSPADIGYPAERFALPPLVVREHRVASDYAPPGMLPGMAATTLTERRMARRSSMGERVALAASLVNANSDPWVVWCDLNDESDALARAIPDAVEVRGSDDPDEKAARLVAFGEGRARAIVTKASIAGFGLNWQHCARMAFVGLSDSWEQYYQAIRRCWRFGQSRPVEVHVIASDGEAATLETIRRKEAAAAEMGAAMVALMRDAMIANLAATTRRADGYEAARPMRLPVWLIENREAA